MAGSPGCWMTADTEKLPGSLSWKCCERSTSRASVWPAGDFHRAEQHAVLAGDRVAIAFLDDEIHPLEAAVALENQITAGVVGDSDHGDHRLRRRGAVSWQCLARRRSGLGRNPRKEQVAASKLARSERIMVTRGSRVRRGVNLTANRGLRLIFTESWRLAKFRIPAFPGVKLA